VKRSGQASRRSATLQGEVLYGPDAEKRATCFLKDEAAERSSFAFVSLTDTAQLPNYDLSLPIRI
jgi:hypothetical protein